MSKITISCEGMNVTIDDKSKSSEGFGSNYTTLSDIINDPNMLNMLEKFMKKHQQPSKDKIDEMYDKCCDVQKKNNTGLEITKSKIGTYVVFLSSIKKKNGDYLVEVSCPIISKFGDKPTLAVIKNCTLTSKNK